MCKMIQGKIHDTIAFSCHLRRQPKPDSRQWPDGQPHRRVDVGCPGCPGISIVVFLWTASPKQSLTQGFQAQRRTHGGDAFLCDKLLHNTRRNLQPCHKYSSIIFFVSSQHVHGRMSLDICSKGRPAKTAHPRRPAGHLARGKMWSNIEGRQCLLSSSCPGVIDGQQAIIWHPVP
jgi:hypothetical protein